MQFNHLTQRYKYFRNLDHLMSLRRRLGQYQRSSRFQCRDGTMK